MVTSTGDDTCVASNGDLTKPQINLAQESHPGSGSTTDDKAADNTNQTEVVSEDVKSHGNNNTLISSEHVPVNSEFTDVAPSGAVAVEKENGDTNREGEQEESDNKDATQFQECPDHLIPDNRTQKVEMEKLLTSVESTTGESDFKEDKEIFFDETEKSSDAVKESLGKTGSFDEVEGSLDKVGKHSDDTEEHEVEVVLCKSDKVSDEVEGPGELDKGIAEVAVGPCLEGESLGKMEEGTGVVGEGPCSTEEGLDAVKESPGEMEEGFAETQVDPCMEGGSLGKVEEGLCVVGVGPCSAEESLDAVKESPGEMEEGSHEMEKVADSETTVSDIAMGTCSATEATDDAILRPTITRHDSSLTTVIQGVILLSVLFFYECHATHVPAGLIVKGIHSVSSNYQNFAFLISMLYCQMAQNIQLNWIKSFNRVKRVK